MLYFRVLPVENRTRVILEAEQEAGRAALGTPVVTAHVVLKQLFLKKRKVLETERLVREEPSSFHIHPGPCLGLSWGRRERGGTARAGMARWDFSTKP